MAKFTFEFVKVIYLFLKLQLPLKFTIKCLNSFRFVL